MEIILNEHNKVEYPPMHTVEHILNQTMVRMFGCERSKNSHIEKRKSKCDYKISIAPTSEQIEAIEATVNEIINQHLSVTSFFVTRDNVPSDVDLSKLPDDASETLRIVKIGDYDICACIGAHVNNTSEIGKFTIISTDYTEQTPATTRITGVYSFCTYLHLLKPNFGILLYFYLCKFL